MSILSKALYTAILVPNSIYPRVIYTRTDLVLCVYNILLYLWCALEGTSPGPVSARPLSDAGN